MHIFNCWKVCAHGTSDKILQQIKDIDHNKVTKDILLKSKTDQFWWFH